MEPKSAENQLSQKPGDWILEMFSPAFVNSRDAIESRDKGPELECQPKIKFVSAFDPESIQRVYQRVHLMLKADEEIRNQVKEDQRTSQTEPSLEAELSIQHDKKIDLHDSTIWNSEELSVLRNVFQAAKGQISELEARLQQAESHNIHLKETLRTQTKELENKSAKLSEAKKANHRLAIHVEDLQHQLKGTSMKLDAVTEMWKEIDQEKLKMMKQMQEMRLAVDSERIARKQAELKLLEANQEIVREKMIAEENSKAKYEQNVFKLEEKVRKVSEDFEEEKQLHARSKKALEHLRNHFASLPLQDILPPSVIAKDQVAHIDYIGT